MKKKFNVKVAKKGGAHPSRKSGKSKLAKACAPTMTPEERFVAEAVDPDHPEAAQFREAVLGMTRPVSQALSSDGPAVAACMRSIKTAVVRAIKDGGHEYGVQVTRVAVGTMDRARFDIPAARKAAAIYSKADVDSISGLRLCPAVDPAIGDCIALDQIAILSGPDAKAAPDRVERASRGPARYNRKPAVWSPAGDWLLLNRALEALFRPPWAHLPEGDPFHDPDAVFSDDWDPARRALVTLMCRSQLPLRKMLVGSGAGKPIVSGAFSTVEHLLKVRCRAEPEVVHRDEVAHRWFDDLRRRGQDDIAVPALLLH